MNVSVYESVTDNVPKPKTVTWERLRETLTKHKVIPIKGGALWSPAEMQEGKTRANENVLRVWSFVADVDDKTPPESLRERWEGLAYCLHSSYSSTAAQPKYRVVFPLKRPVSAADWPDVHRRLSIALLDGHADPSCKDCSRMYYLASCPPERLAEAFTEFADGEPLDPDDFTRYPEPPPEKVQRATPLAPCKAEWEGERVSGDYLTKRALIEEIQKQGGRNQAGFWLAGQLRDNGYSEIEAETYLRDFQQQAPPGDHEYTEQEALSTLKSAFKYERREPWAMPATATGKQTPKPLSASPVIRLSDIVAEEVQWLWHRWIPRGKLTVLDGDPGKGKTTLALEIAARATRGEPLEGDTQPYDPIDVLFLTYEDGLADTIRPRLEAAGADLDRVMSLNIMDPDGVKRLLTLPDDLPLMTEIIRAEGVGLVVIDPLMAALSGEVNSYRDQDIRRVLSQVALIADETGAAFLVLRHLTKGAGGAAIYRGQGSIGIIGAARSGMLLAPDPNDPENKRVLASNKSNLGVSPASLSFCLEKAQGVGRVKWLGVSPLRADELVTTNANAQKRRAKLDEAADFLEDFLSNGPVPSEEVLAEAKKAGISKPTLERAANMLEIKRERVEGIAGAGYWVFRLPDQLALRYSNPA